MARKRSQPSEREPDADPGATASIDVQFSQAAMPKVEMPPEVSGAVDVQFSSTAIPQAADPAASGSVDVQMSGPLPAVKEQAPPRRRNRPRTVPGIIAESISNLPVVKEVMPRSRKGRVMVRSVIVAYLLIGMWIGFIIYFQTRGEMQPDLRPEIEAIFVELRGGERMDERIDAVFDQSSVRFQELTLEETFERMVKDQHETLGDFEEIAAVIRTESFRGPSGRTARADLLLDFEKGRCQGSMSFLFEDGVWRMLGYRLDLPEDLAKVATSDEKREERVQAPQEVIDLVVKILQQSSDDQSQQIYDAAAKVFRDGTTFAKFEELEKQRRKELGAFRFFKVVSAQRSPSGTGAAVTGVATYGDKNFTQAVTMKFVMEDGEWKLSFYKVILPIPHGPVKDQ